MHDISQFTEKCHHTQRVTCYDFPCICCWYYNVYKTLCSFSTLHFWHECVLCASPRCPWVCWAIVGAMVGHGWHNVGWWLVQCWVMVGALLDDGWCNVVWWLVQCWVMVRWWLAQCWVMVGAMLGDGWHNVGWWLAQCRAIVGAK